MLTDGMLHIGYHLSASKGFLAMGKLATSLGTNIFQFFTRNPRGSRAKSLNRKDLDAFLDYARENRLGPLIAHAPYTLNAASNDERIRTFARKTLSEDMVLLENLPGTFYNMHPGSHCGQGMERGIQQVADLLNEVLRTDQRTVVLLETMAGKGSEIGGRFEELRAIIDRVERRELLGVCLDTCHVFDGGYDLRDHLEEVLMDFNERIGLDRLRVLHLNDSLFGLGSHKDRHACIGLGKLGLNAIRSIVNHPSLRNLPFCMETPLHPKGPEFEVALVKSLYEGAR